jgi:hypothetical protein
MKAGSEAKFCGRIKDATDIPLHVSAAGLVLVKAQVAFDDIETQDLITRAKNVCMNRIPVSDRFTAIAVLIGVKQFKQARS